MINSLLVNVYLLVVLVLHVWTSAWSLCWILCDMLCIFISFCLWFSFYFASECIPCLFSNLTTKKHIKQTLNPSFIWVLYLRLCWLVSLALETISGTNIFGAVAEDEAEAYLPWDTYQFSWFKRWTWTSIFEGYFSPKLSQWLLEEWEPGADLLHHYIQGS